ncbi:hypothetical protein [Roseinatronobacter alkalisoli]|uniref:Autotransporter outer membrane beta-barrel domain-containing protein n=1 Tax=Roseinatronobacter alkalisoli TaxID=3028235 RepID=A0ABT5TF33_9RHOB|nr:hypothetical protein [Roseinatronobacter sp. HJB301]MDD7973732.1 hypothetical protein [Roseinatronobacter sp. HJB301]
MLNRKLRLQCKFAPRDSIQPQQHFSPTTAASLPFASRPVLEEADIQSLKDYLAGIDANIIVPQPPAPEEPEPDAAPSEQTWDFSSTGASRSSEGGGVGFERHKGRNLDGPFDRSTVDNDFAGQWEDHTEIVGGKVERELFSAAVASGEFGETGTVFGGNGSVFGASGAFNGQFSFTREGTEGTSPGFRAGTGIEAQASALHGNIGVRDDYVENSQTLARADASGSVLSAETEGKLELVLSPEQMTLTGKLGGELNLIEGRLGGDLIITPRRVVNNSVNAVNWAFNSNIAEPLDENWDIGLKVGGEVAGQVGAQAGVEGRAGYEDGTAQLEAGAKIGLGVGAGVKGRVGLVGADKIWNGLKSGASSAWSGVKSGSQSAWNWIWYD